MLRSAVFSSAGLSVHCLNQMSMGSDLWWGGRARGATAAQRVEVPMAGSRVGAQGG